MIINPSKTFSNVNSSAGEADWGVEVICGEEGKTSDHAAGCEDEVSKLKLEEKNWSKKSIKLEFEKVNWDRDLEAIQMAYLLLSWRVHEKYHFEIYQ